MVACNTFFFFWVFSAVVVFFSSKSVFVAPKTINEIAFSKGAYGSALEMTVKSLRVTAREAKPAKRTFLSTMM